MRESSYCLIVPQSEPEKTQYELERGNGDRDFNSQIDLELSDGLI